MGVFTGFNKTGYNTTGNLGTEGRIGASVALGKTRSTVGSITRKFNYCNRRSTNLTTSFLCTFNNFKK